MAPHALAACCAAILPGLQGVQAGAPADAIVIRKVDGTRLQASGVSLDARAGASISVAGSAVTVVPLGELAAIEFPVRPAPAGAPPPASVLFHDQSRLAGTIRGGDEDRLELTLAGGGDVAVPIDAIRAVFAGPRNATLDVRRFEGLSSGDSLHRRAEVGGDFTRGTLDSFGADGVRFEYALGTATFPWNDVEAVLLARQVELEPPAPPVVSASLRPDGTLRGTLVRLNEQELVLLPAGFEAPVALARDALDALRFDGDRHVWLSDLAPTDVKQVPFLGPEEEFLFPWRADRAVTGGPLVVNGRRYGKGFGCHSRTTLSFALEGAFSAFLAEVGVSDEVMGLPDRGAIEFKVRVDGEERWRSGVLRGGDPAVAVGPIPLAGARTLELVTDFGEGEDVADRGVWGAPLLLR